MELTNDGLFGFLAIMAVSVLVIVFIADTIGNMIVFDNRFMNAFVTGLVFIFLFGAVYFFFGDFESPVLVLVGGFLVFCADLISNMLSFSNRFMNSLLTALITIAALGSVIYFFVAA